MPVSIEDLRRFVDNTDSRPLEGTNQMYVSLDEARGMESFTCVDELYQGILLTTKSNTCQLFAGFPGTGKTTELYRLQERLSPTVAPANPTGSSLTNHLPTAVVFVDFDRYVDRYTPITIADVLRVIAHCLDRAATEAEGKDPDEAIGYLTRFIDFVTKTEIGISKGDLSDSGAKLIFEFRDSPNFRDQMEAALKGRFQLFAQDAHKSMEESIARLRKARGTLAQRVVVIADGLDKLTPRRADETEAIEKSVELLFTSNANLLRLPCHAVYTFPIWLRHRRSDLGGLYDREPIVLPMVKVMGKDETVHKEGIDRLVSLVRKRIPALEDIFGPNLQETLHPLILASGGYLRDLMRLVRNVLQGPMVFPTTKEKIERIVSRLAEDVCRPVLGTDLDLLIEVALTHGVPREDVTKVNQFSRLLAQWLVLAYRNGEEWYDVHPLVKRDSRIKSRLDKAKRF
jgi:hypothetical protein